MQVFLFLLALIAVIRACPQGCVCTGSRCDSCSQGYFNIGQAGEQGICITCPQGCLTCQLGAYNQPQCGSCDDGYNLDSGNHICFMCDPACLTCENVPSNCLSCNPTLILIPNPNDSSDGDCIEDEFCMEGCAECTGTQQIRDMQTNGNSATPQIIYDTVSCSQCLPHQFYHSQSKRCISCHYPCSTCSFDHSAIWTATTKPYWLNLFSQIRAIATTSQNSSLPQFTESSTSTMDQSTKMRWTEEMFIVLYVIKNHANGNDTSTTITALQTVIALNGYVNMNMDRVDRMESIKNYINQATGKSLTLDDVNEEIDIGYSGLSTCSECMQPFFADGEECVKCVEGCSECDGSGCSLCEDGYYLEGVVCMRCDQSCQECDAAGASGCTACFPPLSLTSDSTCVRCNDPCLTCSAAEAGFCLTCKPPYSLTADEGSCFRCDDSHCISCLPNFSTCIQCRQGFIIKSGACIQCPVHCLSCSQDSSFCYECLQGFVSISGICKPCDYGCSKCSTLNVSKCLQCGQGRYLDLIRQRCQLCKDGCNRCNSYQQCLEFDNGMVPFHGLIVKCFIGCKKCSSQNPSKCLECNHKFYLDDESQSCKPCSPGCLNCQSTSTCSQCLINWYPSSNICLPCGNGCKQCTDNNTCTQCMKGYFLQTNGICNRSCSPGCGDCDPYDNMRCLHCKTGYSLKYDNTCVRCLRGCSGRCDPADINRCLTCVKGFEMVDNQCIACPSFCMECVNGDCLHCGEGYILKESSSYSGKRVCVEECLPPCLACDSSNRCSSCSQGYILTNDGKCVPDTTCNPHCQYCVEGTFLNSSSGSCQICTLANCALCQTSSPSTPNSDSCLQCHEGYYLHEDQCVQCQQQCKTCMSAAVCQICGKGYYREIVSMLQNYQNAVYSESCAPCHQSCLSCFLEAERCTSCASGYLQRGDRCLGRYTLKIEMVIEEDYEGFIADSRSQEVIDRIGERINKESEDFLVDSISQGSVSLSLTVSASSSSQAEQLAANSADLSSITGMTVLSQSVSIYYNDRAISSEQEEEQTGAKKNNLGVIIGAAAGGGVVILIIVIICICKNKKQKEKAVDNTYKVKNSGKKGQEQRRNNYKKGQQKRRRIPLEQASSSLEDVSADYYE